MFIVNKGAAVDLGCFYSLSKDQITGSIVLSCYVINPHIFFTSYWVG